MNRNKGLNLWLRLAVLLVLGTALGIHRVYDWSFGFVSVPPTDEELRQWLAGQPGVEGVEVWRQRTPEEVWVTESADRHGVGREEVLRWEGHELRIRYRVRIWRRGPEDITPLWERLGYKGFRGLDGTAHGGPYSTLKTSSLGWEW